MNVLVFDVETVPDTATGSALYGLDGLSEHDIGAYPDFQQTMIKSYHLREA